MNRTIRNLEREEQDASRNITKSKLAAMLQPVLSRALARARQAAGRT